MLPKSDATGNPAQGRRDIRVTGWRTCRKNTLQGFFTAALPSGLVIHDCMLHENKRRWVAFSAIPYKQDDGSTTYRRMIEFSDNAASERFRVAALAAVDRFMEGSCHE